MSPAQAERVAKAIAQKLLETAHGPFPEFKGIPRILQWAEHRPVQVHPAARSAQTACGRAASSIGELKRWVGCSQNNQADLPIHRMAELVSRAPLGGATVVLEKHSHRLYNRLALAVGALEQNRLSEKSFQSFRGIWHIAGDVIGAR